jgi:hypothetical protein
MVSIFEKFIVSLLYLCIVPIGKCVQKLIDQQKRESQKESSF